MNGSLVAGEREREREPTSRQKPAENCSASPSYSIRRLFLFQHYQIWIIYYFSNNYRSTTLLSGRYIPFAHDIISDLFILWKVWDNFKLSPNSFSFSLFNDTLNKSMHTLFKLSQTPPSPPPGSNTSKLLRSKNILSTKNWLAIYYKLYCCKKKANITNCKLNHLGYIIEPSNL